VKSLFFNTPVRKQFQKSLGWDTAEIHKVLTRFSLSFPNVGFFWTSDERLALSCQREETFQQRIGYLLGEEWIKDSVEVGHQQGELYLTGLIGRPYWNCPNRSGQYLFINQRSIVSSWISSQVLESYGTRLSSHRYPLFVLYLRIPPHLLDVNVHPQKKEVRLREEKPISLLIHHAIQNALENQTASHHSLPLLHQVPSLESVLSNPGHSGAKKGSYANTLESLYKEKNPDTIYDQALDAAIVCSMNESLNTYLSPSHPDPVLFDEQAFSIIAKLGNYFFVEEAQGIRVVDGLRAMERIVFDQLHVAPEKQEIQTLLIPIQLNMTGKNATLLSAHLTALNDLGLSIRHFGGDTYLVDAIPAVLEPQEIPEWIMTFLEEGKIPMQLGKCLKRGLLSIGAAAALVKKLFQCQNPNYTPTGKMIHYLLDSKYLERLLL
jgi:DNA mismatch repair protein MutL